MLFSMLIVAYLFLGGTAGGLLACACLWQLALEQRTPAANKRARATFDAFFARCLVVGALALAAAVLCLVCDLGRPERALNLFLTRRPTVLTVGAFSLGIDLAVVLALGAVSYMRVDVPAVVRRTLVAACAALSLVVVIYTGVYLYGLQAVAFWHTPAIVALFAFSSLSCGIAAMLLVAYFTPGAAQLMDRAAPLQHAHVALIALEAIAVVAFVAAAMSNPNASQSVEMLASEQVLPLAVVGVGAFALGGPLAIEACSAAAGALRNVPACDVMCLVGGFLLRYCIVLCGSH